MGKITTERMASFTCLACRVLFVDAELQRSHYKTEWHRYNLKRRIAQFPPVTAEDFADRENLQKQQVCNWTGAFNHAIMQ